MARKNLLAGLTQPKLTAVNSDPASAPRPAAMHFASRGAVGAVTRSIDDLASKANAAKALEAKLISGQVVVELDTGSIDASFIVDRMAQDDEEYRRLRDSMAQAGQGSPILVRPHPTSPGRFQVAFGHRRLRAATELGQPVRAVVRSLTDRELVLAQGQENSARANLSFIERARFAHRLEDSGYDRDTIMQALSTDKTTVSRLITVVQRIPAELIEAIGPAPGTGRDRWAELAALFQRGGLPEAGPRLGSRAFQMADSDGRFLLVLAWASSRKAEQGRPGRTAARRWAHSGGTPVLTIRSTDRATLISIDKASAPGFDAFLLDEMDGLYSRFLAASRKA